ncbi:MAG: hypothetical protein Fur0044_51150 [Anaerolineae bacterium]|nr:DinB family protein [Anaerolineales bacterium]MCQ3978461.1 hypothetical protein [Anaerolineae bacterium]
MSIQNNAVSLLRQQFQMGHQFLEGTVQGVAAEHAHWTPPGKAQPLGANYAHVVISEDGLINMLLKGTPPLMASDWEGKIGLSEMPPQAPPWNEWASRVRVDLDTLRGYAQAVYGATDSYLASLSDEDLNRPLDLSAVGLGQQTVGSFLSTLVFNIHTHTGEIACLKGLQGLQGYPF